MLRRRALQRLRGGAEERLAGIGDRGQGDQRRQPMEQRLRPTASCRSAPPDQTETDSSMMLAAAKPATPSALQQLRDRPASRSSTALVGELGGREAGTRQRFDRGRPRWHGRGVVHGGDASWRRDWRARWRRQAGRPGARLDFAHAAAAMHALDREHGRERDAASSWLPAKAARPRCGSKVVRCRHLSHSAPPRAVDRLGAVCARASSVISQLPRRSPARLAPRSGPARVSASCELDVLAVRGRPPELRPRPCRPRTGGRPARRARA